MTLTEAREVLGAIGAPPRLVVHGELVVEAAEALIASLPSSLRFDAEWVLAGAMLHDAGKTAHPAELDVPGARHEEAGRALLLEHGVAPNVARCCVSHAQWRTIDGGCSLEELLVALADALWKGVRREALEARIIHEVASRTTREPWDVYVELDTAFERIADDGPARLMRSR